MLGGRKRCYSLFQATEINHGLTKGQVIKEVSLAEADGSPVKGHGKNWFAIMPGQ